MNSRHKLIALALTALWLGAGSCAAAQEWPAKPVRIVVPFGAGSTPDIVARLIAEHLQKKSGQTFLIDNKPGASGNLGTDAVAKAAPDGSTIGISIGGPLAINTLLFSKLPYDPATDIAPVTQLITQPSILAVNAKVPVASATELVAMLKRPGAYSFASIGNGSLSHLAMEAIALTAGANMVHVPYASSPAAITAVIRGDVQMACLPAIAVTPHEASGAIRMLAVSTAQRSAFLPQLPTLRESGIDVEADAWNGIIAPGGTPPGLVAKIRAEVVEAIETEAVRSKLAAQLMEPVGSTPAEFRARIESEIGRWAPVVRAANIKIN